MRESCVSREIPCDAASYWAVLLDWHLQPAVLDGLGARLPTHFEVVTNTKDRTVRRNARLGIADCYERTLQFEKATQILEQTEPDPKAPGYIQQRIANIREQQRQRNLAPSKLGWQTKK